MKGLLIKDFYLLIKYCRSVFIISLLFTLISCLGEGNYLFLVYPCVVTSVIPVTLLSCDEREKWISYSGTLPYSKAQLVSAKYMISIFMALYMILQAVIIIGIFSLGRNTFSLGELFETASSLFTMTLLPPTLILPFVFKFGSEKGRIFYYLIVGLICGLAAALNLMENVPADLISSITSTVVFAIAVIAFAGSWMVSIKIYEKKELE